MVERANYIKLWPAVGSEYMGLWRLAYFWSPELVGILCQLEEFFPHAGAS